MQSQMMNMLLMQLKSRNPQMYQVIEKAQQSNGNPIELFKQITKDYSPEQMGKLMSTAKQYGIPDNVLNQIQGINSK